MILHHIAMVLHSITFLGTGRSPALGVAHGVLLFADILLYFVYSHFYFVFTLATGHEDDYAEET
jgi:hypothetical protein